MAPTLRPRGNAQSLKPVDCNGSKRKGDGTSGLQLNPVSKKRKEEKSRDAVPDKQTVCQKAVVDERIIKGFRITFHPQKFCPQRPGNVPKEHQTKFKHIQQLGQMIYESYAVQPRPDITNKPWELENKLRAKRISQKATQARTSSAANACGNPSSRLTRQKAIVEQRPSQNVKNVVQYASVSHCQNSIACELMKSPSNRITINHESSLSTGLSDIFTTRVGERSVIQNDPENRHRIEMQPDRIYGLRTTAAMEKILLEPHNSHLGKDPELEDVLLNRLTISCNPDSGGQASIYPFLVMEAKSLKGGSNFQKIETQTALPIRNHLYLQLKLQEDEFNRMQVPGGPLAWFLAYVGEMWRQNIVLLWEGSITGDDEALQLVLIVDYIVDWARDIFRPSIMRQLMSVVDKGLRSSYTIIEEPDILSIPDHANSWSGDRPVATISGAEMTEVPAQPAFDAMDSTIESSLEPLFQSTGKHVDIRVWEGAKYESRVRGLYITGNDALAETHFSKTGYQRLDTVYQDRCWFLLPRAQDIKTIEQAWTESQEIEDVQDLSPQRIMISLFVQYRKDGDGAPIRELTYLAVAESVFRKVYYLDVLCVTASDFDRLSDRVVLSFHNDRETTPYARRLDSFIKSTCENPRSGLYKVYATCFRYTKAVHSLIVEPCCISNPTQACVFINTEVMSSGLCVYITNAASKEVNDTWLIRHLVQMVVVLRDQEWPDIQNSYPAGVADSIRKILLWIVSDPQWNLYITIKCTLTMPGMNRVHEYLAWFRKVLLRHKCGAGTYEYGSDKEGYRNVQRDIQRACKKCDFKGYRKSRSTLSFPVFVFCDEDYMPDLSPAGWIRSPYA
ncbi:hypothetical protein J1614_003396 [Plenodomus biglobosus]|nr:hypothetical protein J1614_003396 [Plenodomus biglobosus]